jgi:hydroxymethylbilane synthase
MPLAAHARWQPDGRMVLQAVLGSAETEPAALVRSERIETVADVAAAESLGRQVSQQLRDGGGAALLAALQTA